ncbi:MAG TPA: hypothetical protein VGR22_03455 [Thermomicrobiales bacterium]|nr:hypothetical protein [Thermomicrobiales bacterium]
MPVHNSTWGRVLGYLVLFATLFAPMLMTSAATAQDAGTQSGTASVEIHKRLCPTGYSDNNYFQDCHDTPQDGIVFELGSLRASTGADGSVSFVELLGGTYTITESIPGDAAESVVFCSYAEQLEQNASFTYVPGGISLDVPGGSDIVCDWYNIPYNLRGDPGDAPDGEGSSITIHARLCPPGYTGNQPFEVCHDTPKTNRTFSLGNLSATTGADGNTLFYQLNAGTYTVREAGQGEFLYYNVFCSLAEDVNQSVPVTATDNGVQIDVPAGTDIICDWYNIPESGPGDGDDGDEPGTLTIHKAVCPPGYEGQQYFQDCHDTRAEGVAFDVLGPEGLLLTDITTNAQGVLTIDNIVVGGSVDVLEQFPNDLNTAVFVVYCSDDASNRVPFDYVERDDAGGIEINVFRGDDVLCDWYDIPAA